MWDKSKKQLSVIGADPTKTAVYRSSFFPRTAIEWNNLEQEIVARQ